ncbi:MAG TPA: cytochrome c3 family protein [Acidobacteriaceae bacterium]
MPQIFDRSSNALARMSLVLTGLIVIALGVTLDQLQRSPWVTRQGQRADQPVPFSHKHHVQGLGLQCQYCHTTVEKAAYAGVPPTKTCINCHAQIWTNANLLEPVRESWATGESLPWTRVHDLPDYAYFNHQIHVNKGLGCSSCHGRVDEMPIMYQQNTLQMEWCLNCHRNPAKNLRPVGEIYNMAWAEPSPLHPVWCKAVGGPTGVPTAQTVSCVSAAPGTSVGTAADEAALTMPAAGAPTGLHGQMVSDSGPGLALPAEAGAAAVPGNAPASVQVAQRLGAAAYVRFTSQAALGGYLIEHYHIRSPRELSSCEVCHR